MNPPTWLAPSTRTPLPMGRREGKAARTVLVQCERCGCNGSGHTNARGRVVAVNIAAASARGTWRHIGCGGDLAAFDIEVA